MEWLWQVDEDDKPLGRVERGVAHQRLVLHRSGIVFLVNGRRKVFLTRRAASKAIFPGRHDSSASFHVSHKESYGQAARREALEELGLEGALIEIGKFRHLDPPESQFVAVFLMLDGGSCVQLDANEASSGEFCSLAAALKVVREEPCTPWLRDGLPILADWMRRSV